MQQYFSVKKSVNIAGKTYMPCICYPLTEYLKLTIEMLERNGTATIHKNKVAFQNGKELAVGTDGKIIPVGDKRTPKERQQAYLKEHIRGIEEETQATTRRKKKTVVVETQEDVEIAEEVEDDTPEEGF